MFLGTPLPQKGGCYIFALICSTLPYKGEEDTCPTILPPPGWCPGAPFWACHWAGQSQHEDRRQKRLLRLLGWTKPTLESKNGEFFFIDEKTYKSVQYLAKTSFEFGMTGVFGLIKYAYPATPPPKRGGDTHPYTHYPISEERGGSTYISKAPTS